jgi:hypothetical protein
MLDKNLIKILEFLMPVLTGIKIVIAPTADTLYPAPIKPLIKTSKNGKRE